MNKLEQQYREWEHKNPTVFSLYKRFAAEAFKAGKKFSISLLTERVRWEAVMTWGPDKEGFKVNNNYRAYIARDLLRLHPEYGTCLHTRTVTQEEL